MSSTQKVRLVCVGAGATGKTCLIVMYVQRVFCVTYDPSIEDYYSRGASIDGKAILLSIVDTAGQEEFSSLREYALATGEGFILCYAINNRSSFYEASEIHDQILRVKDKKPSEIPLVITGNKCDLVKEREVSFEEGQSFAESLGNVPFLETSAKDRINVNETFAEAVRQVWKKQPKNVLDVHPAKKPKKGCIIF